MFALRIDYVTGKCVASNSEGKAEWPPHPIRLYYAMVKAFKEFCDGTDLERKTLEWFESLESPALTFSKATFRRQVTSFVPRNDVKLKECFRTGPSFNPILTNRSKTDKSIATAMPYNPHVDFSWADVSIPKELEQTFRDLLSKVTYLGNSTSLVDVFICDNPREPTIVPCVSKPESYLRSPYQGLLTTLENVFEEYHNSGEKTNNKGYLKNPAGRPKTLNCRDIGYKKAITLQKEVTSTFDSKNWVVYEIEGHDVYGDMTLHLTSALRNASLKIADGKVGDEALELISGHPTGNVEAAVKKDHLAYIPLVDVGHKYARGRIIGLGVLIPPKVSGQTRTEILYVLSKVKKLWLGELGEWYLNRQVKPGHLKTLHPATWTYCTKHWTTATPVVLESSKNIAEQIGKMCSYIGLPTPVGVQIEGDKQRFPRFPLTSKRPKKIHTHLVIEFPVPVIGPVILGSGRFLGYGLCRPVKSNCSL